MCCTLTPEPVVPSSKSQMESKILSGSISVVSVNVTGSPTFGFSGDTVKEHTMLVVPTEIVSFAGSAEASTTSAVTSAV